MHNKLQIYLKMIKSLQTGLLLTTGLAGYMSARCPVLNFSTLLTIAGSLFLAISGSTVLNMWYDRDIDARMKRTCLRPLPSGAVSGTEGLLLGLVLSAAGVGWSLMMDPLYGLVVFAGLFFDVFIYTVWLKRRTAWSIVFGGISGGMPVLAGRVFAVGELDAIGFILAAGVLFWIPTHIMTFNIRHFEDYAAAGIPTFPSVYGNEITRKVIAGSSILSALAMAVSAFLIGLGPNSMHLIAAFSLILLFVAIASMLQPSPKLNFGLFKYASFYMLGAMLVIFFQGF